MTKLLSKLSLHWPGETTISTKSPSVVYQKRDVCRTPKQSPTRWLARDTAALKGGKNLLPNIKLLRDAIVEFYATETKGGTSNLKWILHTSGIRLQPTLVSFYVLVSYQSC